MATIMFLLQGEHVKNARVRFSHGTPAEMKSKPASPASVIPFLFQAEAIIKAKEAPDALVAAHALNIVTHTSFEIHPPEKAVVRKIFRFYRELMFVLFLVLQDAHVLITQREAYEFN